MSVESEPKFQTPPPAIQKFLVSGKDISSPKLIDLHSPAAGHNSPAAGHNRILLKMLFIVRIAPLVDRSSFYLSWFYFIWW